MSKETIVVLPIKSIKEVFFVRAKMDENHALHLAELVEAGVKLPPIEVAKDGDGTILVDGRHRLYAYGTVLDRKSIPAIYVKGDREELLLRAIRANTGGAAATNGSDINLVIKQLIAMGVSKTKIVQEMSMPHLPFTPSLIRRHLETVNNQMTRDQLVAAQHAVVEGMTAPAAAEKFNIPLPRLQGVLSGSKKKRTQIHDLMGNLTKTSHSRSRIMSNIVTKVFEMFEDGEVRASQVEMLLDQIAGLNKRSNKMHRDWVARFEDRKRLINQEKKAAS